MEATRKIEIDMGHRLPNHDGQCAGLHGHRYVLQLTAHGEPIDEDGHHKEGMVIDFSHLKDVLMTYIHDTCDHSTVLRKDDRLLDALSEDPSTNVIPVDFVPTVENLAEHWYNILDEALADRGVKIKRLKVYETPNNWVIYRGENE